MKNNLEKIATDFKFLEGPLWNASDNYLLFSDIPANRIYRWSKQDGVRVFREPSRKSNGLTYDNEGRLLVCEHENRRLSRIEDDGTYHVLVSDFAGRLLNSPNDVIVKKDGSIYFTDPPYGIKPSQKELSFQGVFRFNPVNNDLTLLADDFIRPNGLAFSPDETVLYVADSSKRRHIRAFDVEPDGNIVNSHIFAVISSELEGNPDGLKVDIEGNLYAAAAGGIWIFSEKGKQIDTISTPETPANLAWGGEDWKSLYITARTSLYHTRVGISGIRVS